MVAFSVITPRRRSSSVYCGRSFSGKRRRTSTKNSGTKKIASTVAEIIPPITPVPTACWLPEPARGAGRHRQHAEDERQRGHQDGAQALTASRQRGAEQILALLVELIGELDDQNGVFRRQADHRQQTHLEVHVILQPAHPGRQQGANHPQRHHQHHRERHRPARTAPPGTGTPPAEKSRTG